MKFINELMSDPKVQYKKIGDFAKRSKRNEWAESNEKMLRDLSPFPISYDVSQTQPINFSEFTYTEFLNGLWTACQSLELNSKIINDASLIDSDINILEEMRENLTDKYILEEVPDKFSKLKKICFLPGHNALDIASTEMISRLVAEDDNVFFKPHPITNEESLKMIANIVGWHKLIPKDISGNTLLYNCSEIYTTSASEMSITGTILGKKVINVSNFFNEGSGSYHSISRIIFISHKESVTLARQKLANIFNCYWSGFIFPNQENTEERINEYFNKSLKYREIFKPLSYPRGSGPTKIKPTIR